MAAEYKPSNIEPKWQQYWETNQTFRVPNPGDPGFDPEKPKFYALDMFPYPSGAGLHVGHPEGYTATDIISRYKRMMGYNVLHPMGWDAFGLPAEQYAIQTGIHPAETTLKSIDNFRRQLKAFGFCYDWSREFGTIDPDYYKWTQWIFIQIYNAWFDTDLRRARPINELIEEFESGKREPIVNPNAAEHAQNENITRGLNWKSLDARTRRTVIDSYRLAYLAEQTVNWCPKLGTALANEEVIDGKSERGGYPVFRKPLRQWMFRITAYADRLLHGLDNVDWPEMTRTLQANWIGRSEGAEIEFPLLDASGKQSGASLRVFTTRPDTVFGATYMVVAPEHSLVEKTLAAPLPETDAKKLADYVSRARHRADVERQESKEKTGVFTGVYAWNPLTEQPIPVWTADYVLMGYGTGAIMAVPGSDARDYEFAKRFKLPVIQVVAPRTLEDAAQGIYVPEDETAAYGLARSPNGSSYVKIDEGCFPGEGIAVNSSRSDERCGTGVSPVAIGEESHITRRNLPHIQRGGSTYFVTFRTFQGNLSEHERDLVVTACDHWHGEKITVHAAIVMPDHVHLLMTPHEREPGQWYSLTEILHSIKSYTAHQIAKVRRSEGPVWLDESFDRLIRDEREFVEKWEYIEANAVTADLVSEPSSYKWLVLRQVGFQNTEHRRDAGATERKTAGPCELNGLSTADAKRCIIDWLEENKYGRGRINFKLRDWLFSRQRYWGEPFPIVFDEHGNHHAVSEDALPVELPPLADYQPIESDEPTPLLGKATEWLNTTAGKAQVPDLPPDAQVRRETNTMPGWAGSCWYFLRYCDPKNSEKLIGDSADRYWMGENGVDLYIGGSEHAVLHLLYARFWHMALHDLGHVHSREPFGKLFHQGLITSFAFKDSENRIVPIDEVEERDDKFYLKSNGEQVEQIVAKMSKTLKNVVNPDDIIHEFGADTFRLYEMYMGPLEASKPWNTKDTVGLFRFLRDIWRLCVDIETDQLRFADKPDADVEKHLHKTIAKVGGDIERLAFNTAIAAMFEFKNTAQAAQKRQPNGNPFTRDQVDRVARILAPFAPHFAEELWHRLGNVSESSGTSIAMAEWPTYDEALLVEAEIEIPVQINGKLIDRITVPRDADEGVIKSAAMERERVTARIGDGNVVKTIYVPGRMLNFIVK